MSIRVKMDNQVSRMDSLLRNIVWAINKGIGDDVREYLSETHKETNNAIILMRGDNINTNLRNFVVSDTVELKKFRRSAWQGRILIDRENKFTITITIIRKMVQFLFELFSITFPDKKLQKLGLTSTAEHKAIAILFSLIIPSMG